MNTTAPQAQTIQIAKVIGKQAWGNDLGREGFQKLDALIRASNAQVFALDFSDVDVVDASWSREAVVNLVKRYQGKVAFYVRGANSSILENIDAAFVKSELTILARVEKGDRKLLGLQLKEHLAETLEALEGAGETTTSDIVKRFKGLSLQNCNNRMKQIVSMGLAVRLQRNATGGGKEFVYRAVR